MNLYAKRALLVITVPVVYVGMIPAIIFEEIFTTPIALYKLSLIRRLWRGERADYDDDDEGNPKRHWNG